MKPFNVLYPRLKPGISSNFFVFAENGSRGKGSCRSFVSFFRLGGYTIRTLRVLAASARGCSCYSYWSSLLPTLFARFACSARGGAYTIRTLRVLSASVAASASYTIRTLRVLRAALLRSASAWHTHEHTSALLRDTHTNTRYRCLFFISKDRENNGEDRENIDRGRSIISLLYHSGGWHQIDSDYVSFIMWIPAV